MNKEKLPVDDFIDEIINQSQTNMSCVIVAEPGAGKTTRVPAALLSHCQGKIIVLEPRRIAAVSAAIRICDENEFQLGQEVGYQVRFENQCQDHTRLVFMTEALLNRLLLEDPQLSGVDYVILDEFHERSHHVDLALGLIFELQQLGHPIRLIVMSATIDADRIAKYLGNAPIIQVPGKLHPLEIEYQKNSQILQMNPTFYQQVEIALQKALLKSQRDILVFLPGIGEIQRLTQLLSENDKYQNYAVVQLHGRMQISEQKKAIQRWLQRKIILTTNIAESAVTVDGVDCVIDSGLEKSVSFDANTGFQKMQLQRISQASAKQRAGRAARQFPGYVYRLWNQLDEVSMPKNIAAEILQIDLSEPLMYLAAQGISSFQNFSWYERPTEMHLIKATERLQQLELIDQHNALTEKGRLLLHFPVSIRQALILIRGVMLNEIEHASRIAAVLQEKDFTSESDRQTGRAMKLECDVLLKIETYLQRTKYLSQIQKSEQQLIKLSQKLSRDKYFKNNESNKNDFLSLTQDIILFAFKDRLCRRRGQTDKALMINGKGVQLSSQSIVCDSEFFLAIDILDLDKADSQARTAVGLNKKQVEKYYEKQILNSEVIELDTEKGLFYKYNFPVIGKIKLHDGQITKATQDEISSQLPQIIIKQIDLLEKNNVQFSYFINQIRFLNHHHHLCPENIQNQLRFIYNENVLQSEFISRLVNDICYGENNLQKIYEKEIVYFIEQSVGKEFYQYLKTEVPTHIQVPTERWIPIEYNSDWQPSISVKLQECFGLAQNPKMLNGQITVALQLLAPNQRPVQITADIAGFWKGSYFEVRKELKARYPKHDWPDDPANAIPTRKTKNRT